jgi:A/G-specific adenine glycosylase
VLVSEVMLQQTPVARVLPVHDAWLARWGAPAGLAADSPGEAVRAWGRLGYPRRALRLHAAAATIVAEHGGEVPDDLAALRALPGVGEYTAAAVAAFAFGRRVAVLDTNVRRVLARVATGAAAPAVHLTRAERELAHHLLPAEPSTAARWSVSVMELGALVCTASAPRCDACPLASSCRWLAAGRPATTAPRRVQPFAGTDRQVRGLLLGAVRDAGAPVPAHVLHLLWPDDEQRDRALASLLVDGLLQAVDGDRYRLPA